jgi:hypothetical protein
MASVEQYLSVLAGALQAQNSGAQRQAAQMQIEVPPWSPLRRHPHPARPSPLARDPE